MVTRMDNQFRSGSAPDRYERRVPCAHRLGRVERTATAAVRKVRLMSWELLSGCVEEYFNQQLLDLGRYRFHRDNGTGPEYYTPVKPEVTVCRLAFLAQREPWRLVSIGRDEAEGSILAFADDAWVTLRGDPVVPDGDASTADHDASTRGDHCVRALLEPTWLEEVLGAPMTSDVFDVSPERLLLVTLDAGGRGLGLVSIGADRHEVTYDRRLEIVTSWTTYIDGAVARRNSVSQLNALR
jgi:hypothetical protein